MLGLNHRFAVALAAVVIAGSAHAEVKVGQKAPDFTLKNQDGKVISLASRQGAGWTVLYFYPKAGTPGCTKQACAFRDAIQPIRDRHAEVYGISMDDTAAQKKFHDEHKLPFDLLADPEDKAIEAYGIKVPVLGVAKRWTFIIDPNLVVRNIAQDVDPLLDAKNSAAKLDELQKATPAASGQKS